MNQTLFIPLAAPKFGTVNILSPNSVDSTSFTVQARVSPTKVAKFSSLFSLEERFNTFVFCSESGVEYFLHIVEFEGDLRTVVTIIDSLDPSKDMDEFYWWLADKKFLDQ